jgi:exopolysaccharide biosynthesis polyprenyl glycosylphosphotransferase
MHSMMNQDRKILKRIELVTDVVLTSMVFVATYAAIQSLPIVSLKAMTAAPHYFLLLLMVILIWYVTLDIVIIDSRYGAKMTIPLAIEIFRGVTIATIVLVVCMYAFQLSDVSRLLIFLFYIADLIILNLARWLIDRLVASKRNDSYFQRHVLILGSRTAAQELIQMVCNQQESFIKIVGCVELSREDVGKTVSCGVQVIGTLEDLRDILLYQVIDEVLITMPLNEIKDSEWHLSFINTFGITVRIIPYWYIRKFMVIHKTHSVKIEQFISEPALIISRIQRQQDAMAVKSIMDYVIALFALVLTSPLFVIVPCLIKSFSKGPVFYRQIRSGQDGRKFTLLKFRSMVMGAEEQQYTLITLNEADGPAFKIKNDPRIIPYVGKFIRKFGLDELPQFINVIRGEMSIVGPRPPTPAEVEKYELWQRRRLSMKPGITCIWQVQPDRNEITFDKWMNMDMDYIDHWSLWLDIVLMCKTIPTIFIGHGR